MDKCPKCNMAWDSLSHQFCIHEEMKAKDEQIVTLKAQLADRDEMLVEMRYLLQGWIDAEDEPRHAPPMLIPRTTAIIKGELGGGE